MSDDRAYKLREIFKEISKSLDPHAKDTLQITLTLAEDQPIQYKTAARLLECIYNNQNSDAADNYKSKVSEMYELLTGFPLETPAPETKANLDQSQLEEKVSE